MRQVYDWIVIGGGITGSALAYELVKQKFKVLLLDKDSLISANATSYSYGGLAYWSGTDALTRLLAQEGIDIHRHLSVELAADTEFRELNLLLTLNKSDNPSEVSANYQKFAIKPEFLTAKLANELEPLLNINNISGVLKLPHAQINPAQTNLAYQQAFLRQGGHRTIALVRNLLTSANTIRGVETNLGNFYAANTVICAGGLTRRLLPTENLNLPLYFTYAQLIKTPPVTTQLNSLIMPAVQARFTLEAQASQLDWLSLEQDNIPNSAKIPPILDIGAAQFKDGSICLGQISGIPANLGIELDLQQAEAKIRQGIANILPSLANLPGKCHQCLVAFTHPGIAVIGQLPQHPGGYIFSGFTSALLYTPPLARRFAQWATGQTDQIIAKLTASLN